RRDQQHVDVRRVRRRAALPAGGAVRACAAADPARAPAAGARARPSSRLAWMNAMLESWTRPPDESSGGPFRTSVPTSTVPASSPTTPRPKRAVPLEDLLAALEEPVELGGDPGVPVGALVYRSGDVEPGALFVCVPGSRSDGH